MRGRPIVLGLFVAVAAAVYTTGPLYRVRSWWDYRDPLAEDRTVVAVYAIVAAGGLVVLATGDRWRRVPPSLAVTAGALAGWYVLSSAWSFDPGLTLRESLFIAGALVVGAASATALEPREMFSSVWLGVHAGLAWSFLAIAVGANGSVDADNDYVGVFFNRNSLGLYAALGALISALLLLDAAQSWRRTRAPATLLVAVVLGAAVLADVWLMAGAASITPVVACAIAGLVAVLVVPARSLVDGRRSPRLVLVLIGAAASAVVVAGWLTRGTWLDRLGRRADLTGRVDIWEVTLDHVGDRPVHGYGYLGKWSDPAFVAEVRAASGHQLTSAHNSFLEALLGGGVIGLAVFVAFVVAVYLLAGTAALTRRGAMALLPLAVFSFLVVECVAETLVVGSQLTVALLVACGIAGSRTVSAAPSGPLDEQDALELFGVRRP